MPEVNDTSPMGWAQFFRTLADRYGLPAVALTVITGAVFFQGNRVLESFRKEQAEDKLYFRSEFKTIVENNTKALQEVQITRGKLVDCLEENTEEIKALLSHHREEELRNP